MTATERRRWRNANLFKWCDGDSLSPAEATERHHHHQYTSLVRFECSIKTNMTAGTMALSTNVANSVRECIHFLWERMAWCNCCCITTNSWMFSFGTKHQPPHSYTYTHTHTWTTARGKLLSVAPHENRPPAGIKCDRTVYLILAHRSRKHSHTITHAHRKCCRSCLQRTDTESETQTDGKSYSMHSQILCKAGKHYHPSKFSVMLLLRRSVGAAGRYIFVQGFEMHVALTKTE